MPIWAAARCTTAAVPYFKPLEWQGQILLDGGLELNCPAACADTEAKSIWPDKRCDILLSLGAGRGKNDQPLAPGFTPDTDAAWDGFYASSPPPQKHILFRLSPTYSGTGFKLDEFGKLYEIEKQAEEWVSTQKPLINSICDRLIAALFFFRPFGRTTDGVLDGEIVCRLPAGLGARQRLVEAMLQQDLNRFVIEYNGRLPGMHMNVSIGGILDGYSPAAEFRLPVKLKDLSISGRTRVHIEMRSLRRVKTLPISGSPFLI
jgi:hypothetical protein